MSSSRRQKRKQGKSEKKKDLRVQEFMSVTMLSNAILAREYLEASNWQLQNAVALYFAANPESKQTASAPRPPTMDGVRAPIPIKRQRLTDDFDVGFSGGSRDHVPLEPFRQYAKETGSGADRGRDLSVLFEPPHEILFRGGFEHLMREAQQKKRLILVNIQSTTDFDSHKLNRDTWKDETIKEIIDESFLFWQQDKTATCVQRYLTMYKIMSFPHIGILDYRTGEMVLKRTGFLKTPDMMSILFSVIEKYGDDDEEEEEQGDEEKEEEEDEKKCEEDDKMAITPIKAVKTKQETINENITTTTTTNTTTTTTTKKAAPIALPTIKSEPEIGPTVTSIQFRCRDGNRFARRFLKDQTVQDVYDFVSSKRQQSESEFDLRLSYPPKSLTPMKMKTIEEASLLRSLITVVETL